MSQLSLSDLEIFVAVAEHGSFSAAARTLQRSQPSVSARIAFLEEVLGARLFDRRRRGIVLTPAADALLSHAEKMLQIEKEARLAVEGVQGEVQGLLEVGASAIPGNHILPVALARYRKTYDAVKIRLHVGDSSSIIERVLAGVDEVGVVGRRPKQSQLEAEALWEDELVLVVPADHPWAGRQSVAASELSDQPFVVREEGSGSRDLFLRSLAESKGRRKVSLNVVGRCGSSTSLRLAVQEGMGVAVVSRRAVEGDVKAGRLVTVRIRAMKLKRNFWLVTDRGRTLSPPAKAFCQSVRMR